MKRERRKLCAALFVMATAIAPVQAQTSQAGTGPNAKCWTISGETTLACAQGDPTCTCINQGQGNLSRSGTLTFTTTEPPTFSSFTCPDGYEIVKTADSKYKCAKPSQLFEPNKP